MTFLELLPAAGAWTLDWIASITASFPRPPGYETHCKLSNPRNAKG